jgi:hypothetical protein
VVARKTGVEPAGGWSTESSRAAKGAAELVLRNELDRAAAAAVDAIRERAIPEYRRHVLVVDGQEIEVVETGAVEDALASR